MVEVIVGLVVVLVIAGGVAYARQKNQEKRDSFVENPMSTVEPIEPTKAAKAPTTKAKAAPVEKKVKLAADSTLKSMTKVKLVEYAKKTHGVALSTNLTKPQMIADLKAKTR